MIRKLTYIIFIALALLLTSGKKLHFDNEGLKKFKFQLRDGQTMNIDTNVVDIENNLILPKYFPNINSAIIRSFERDNISIQTLLKYVTIISDSEPKGLGYWNVAPQKVIIGPNWGFLCFDRPNYDHNADEFVEYYHSIFQNKTARSFLFKQALDYVYTQCVENPADYKLNVLHELSILISFTNSLENNKTNIDTDNLEDYWQGFIYRRYTSDNVPISEIRTLLNSAVLKIESLNTTKHPDFMYEYIINDEILIFISSNNYCVMSKRNQQKLKFNKNISIQKIRYFEDNTGKYYQLYGKESERKLSLLFDENLNEIK